MGNHLWTLQKLKVFWCVCDNDCNPVGCDDYFRYCGQWEYKTVQRNGRQWLKSQVKSLPVVDYWGGAAFQANLDWWQASDQVATLAFTSGDPFADSSFVRRLQLSPTWFCSATVAAYRCRLGTNCWMHRLVLIIRPLFYSHKKAGLLCSVTR